MKEKRIFRWWWSWNAEKTSTWLESMAKNGWILQRTTCSMLNFYFTKETPRRLSFSADYQTANHKEYVTFMTQAGWNLVSETGGWHLWSKEYGDNEGKPGFFSDTDSLISRNNRILALLSPITVMEILFLISINTVPPSGRSEFLDGFYCGISIVLGMFTLALIYAIIQTLRSNTRLKRRYQPY